MYSQRFKGGASDSEFISGKYIAKKAKIKAASKDFMHKEKVLV